MDAQSISEGKLGFQWVRKAFWFGNLVFKPPLEKQRSPCSALFEQHEHNTAAELWRKEGSMAMRMLVTILVSLVAIAFGHHPTMGGGSGHKGYSLGIRDSIMIAHSFEGPEFGPAQQVLPLCLSYKPLA